MSKALIGNTGFVGSTLTEQTSFTHFFRSTNIEQIENQNFESIVCALSLIHISEPTRPY